MTIDPGLASWLSLTLTPGLGAAAVRGLLKTYGLPDAVLGRRRAELAPYATQAAIQALDSDEVRAAVERALEWSAAPGHYIVTLADERYPRTLLEIPDPPTLLYAAG